MQTLKVQSWSISIRYRPKGFDFKFRASKILQNRKIEETHSVSFLHKLRRICLKLKSGSRESIRKLKPKFQRSELSIGNHRNLDFPANSSCRSFDEAIIASVTGNLALLSHSVSNNDLGGIAVHAFTVIFYLVSLFRNSLAVKTQLPLFLVASGASSTGFYLNYLNFNGQISEGFWKAWNQAITVGCLCILTRIIFWRISMHIERKNFGVMAVWALLPLFMHMAYRGELSKCMKELTETIPLWIAYLLLTCQTMSQVIKNPGELQKLSILTPSAPLLVKEMARILALI